jgi:hypothetical protein
MSQSNHASDCATHKWQPKFGDPVINLDASEENPTRYGFFVRVVRRTGRLNPGTWWECITPSYNANETWLHKPGGMAPSTDIDCATHNGPVVEAGILSKLADLHKQATTERSHYYVASVVREAITAINRLQEMLNHFGRLAEQDHNHLTAEIDRLRAALTNRASDPAP